MSQSKMLICNSVLSPFVPVYCDDENRLFYDEKEGSINGYQPAYSDGSSSCAYFIGAPDAQQIEVTIHSFQLLGPNDQFAIGSGSISYTSTYEWYTLNSSVPEEPLEIEGNRVWLYLHVDEDSEDASFSLDFKIGLYLHLLSSYTTTGIIHKATCNVVI